MSRDPAIVVTGRMPWPLDDGGRIGLWQSVWSCAQTWNVTLVSLVAPGEERDPVPAALDRLGVEVIRVPHRVPTLPVAAVRGVLGRWPYTLTRYRSARLESVLRRLVFERRPVFVWLNHLHVATALDALKGTRVVLREHNLEHVWLHRYAEGLASPWIRVYASHQARRMRRVEAELCSRCDLILAIQDLERDVLRSMSPGTRIETVPIGIDFGRFQERDPASPPVLLLTGSFGWPPNEEGAQRFLDEGWPRVRARVAGVRLRLVGKGLSRDLAGRAAAAGAEAIGYVEDIAPEFARASALVVPLWVGAGARVKIVDALAARLPVVSTSLGAEGLGLTPGREVVLAETAVGLGEAAADLLLQPSRMALIAEAGYEFARSRFSLDAVADRTRRLVSGMIADTVRN